mgnify:CR=1 FL=1
MKANYRLGAFYLSSKDIIKAKTYFLAATKDKLDTSVEALGSLYNLSLIAVEEKGNKIVDGYILDMIKRTKDKDL